MPAESTGVILKSGPAPQGDKSTSLPACLLPSSYHRALGAVRDFPMVRTDAQCWCGVKPAFGGPMGGRRGVTAPLPMQLWELQAQPALLARGRLLPGLPAWLERDPLPGALHTRLPR